ncbi:MAG: PaaI family thioesterase [Chloroflexota bacterium]|nr:PaaI family thioesterase [Chloroflexota bacterium]
MDTDWAAVKERFDSSPYAVLLGMKLVELTTGYAKVELQLRDEFNNWDGRPQGGLIISLLDQAFGAALNTLERVYVAVQLNVNFVAPATGSTLYAESTVLHRGKSLGVSEMTVTDSNGRLVARGLGTTLGIGERGEPSDARQK